jgi:hypothetical protein
MFAFFAFMWWGALMHSLDVRMHCDRSAGTCTITSSRGPYSEAREVALSSIRSARLDPMGVSYKVVLVRTSGDDPISSASSTDRSQRLAVRDQIERFLGDPAQPTLDVVYDDQGAPTLLWLSVLGAVCLAWSLTIYARVEVDVAAGTLKVSVVRWPVPPRRRSFALGTVRDVVLVDRTHLLGGHTYSVGLVVDGNARPVPLLFFTFANRRDPSDRTTKELRDLLANARAEIAGRA